MEIKTFTVADLKTALVSEDFWLTKTLPITKHRALSYSRNPRADEDDPVLLVAYQDNRVIGYLGILPDKIFVNDAVYKLGWLTSWWVDPSCATAGVGAILLFKALNAYYQYIGVSGVAALAVWQSRLSVIPGLEKLAWESIGPEFDPYKYNSFTINAAVQVRRLTVSMAAAVDSG